MEKFSDLKTFSIRKKRLLSFLINTAKENEKSRFKLAAMIVHKNIPVSIGFNSYKTDPFQAKFGKNELAICLHAEINAIKKSLNILSPKELKESSLFIARVKNYDRDTGIAKPCIGCQKAILEFNLKHVLWTTDDKNIIGEVFY